jgi:hypothetical protein
VAEGAGEGEVKRTDSNQRAIVKVWRQCGASVLVLSSVGRGPGSLPKGTPDVVVAFQGRTFFAELKRPGCDLTDEERDWHQAWRGQVVIVRTVEEAVALVTEVRR